MSKESKYKNPIKKALENASLNYINLIDLIEEVKKDLNMAKSNYKSANFFEELIKQLKKSEIRIKGYDFSIHKNNDRRIQSFVKEGIQFELVKTDHVEIRLVLDQLKDNDINIVKNAQIKLQELFIRKFRQMEEEQNIEHGNIKENFSGMRRFRKGSSRFVSINVLTYLEWMKNSLIKELSLPHFRPMTVINGVEIYRRPWQITEDDIEEYCNNFQSMLNKYKEKSSDNRYKNVEHILNRYKKEAMKNSFVSETTDLWYSLDEPHNHPISGDPIFVSTHDPNIVIKLLEKQGWTFKESKSDKEISNLFRKVLFYLNLKEDQFLKNIFTLALSDEEESLNWFEYIITDAETNFRTLDDKLEEDFLKQIFIIP